MGGGGVVEEYSRSLIVTVALSPVIFFFCIFVFSLRPWHWSMVIIYGKRTVMRKQAWCFSVLNTGRWHMMHLLLHLTGDRQCAWPLICSLLTPTWLTLPAVWQVSVFFGLSLLVSTVIQYVHSKPVLLKVSNVPLAFPLHV